MATWAEMSRDALKSAEILFSIGQYRSSISRSYYAVYCAATYEITKNTTKFTRNWNNPPHNEIPGYLRQLKGRPEFTTRDMRKKFNAMRKHRVDADYFPSRTVDKQIAEYCRYTARQICDELIGEMK